MDNHIFPKWTNSIKFWAAILGGGAATYAVAFVWYVPEAYTGPAQFELDNVQIVE